MDKCMWGHDDCQREKDYCSLCLTESYHYKPPKKKSGGLKARANKEDKRMGSSFEFRNHESIKRVLDGTSTRMTPNSGAGFIKGDQEISGLVSIMEELKTRIVEQAPGKKTFTIQKEWLDKLNREARAAKKEMWYLKFSFNQYDDDVYVIVEQDMVMSMVKTMVEDRKKAIGAKIDIDVANNRAKLVEAEKVSLLAKIELLESQIKQLELRLDEKPD